MTWQQFVVENGWYARGADLAVVLGLDVATIDRVRHGARGVCRRLARRLDFGELFARWHGRPPRDDEWPAPHREGCRSFVWLKPELALLARLVGTMSVRELAAVLSSRLRRLTGDETAERNAQAVQTQINRLGLQSGTDLLGGLTTRDAARIAGRVSLVNQAIYNGQLRTFRVGHRHVIPRAEFDRWIATRGQPPEGWVTLASLREPLGIASDSKLPEYACLGYIPGAVRIHVGGPRGTWYIAPELARQILEDAKAGRSLPWHGKPLPSNQRSMWKKWQARRHRRCHRCRSIWKGSPPRTFEAFCARYAAISIGDKRHLTIDLKRRRARPSRPYGTTWKHRRAGITVYEAAQQLQLPSRWIRLQIRRGVLGKAGLRREAGGGDPVRITPKGLERLRTEAAAIDNRDWIGVHAAAQLVGVCIATIHAWRRANVVIWKQGPRGVVFERESLEANAREYWEWARRRYKRASPPAWLAAA